MKKSNNIIGFASDSSDLFSKYYLERFIGYCNTYLDLLSV
jgi:hypothetical protein